ncbi:MAG TPA: 6-phosphogluconolactonase [Pseudolabrys sp.]|nr:6-phosphogluconolactonase [Pseudolabrys sp.]
MVHFRYCPSGYKAIAEWLCALACPCEREFAICLSGGSTPRRLYQPLAEEIIESRFPWKHVHWLWGDEGFVPHDDPDSNYRMAYDALFSRAPPRFSCDRGEQEKNSSKNSRWRYQDTGRANLPDRQSVLVCGSCCHVQLKLVSRVQRTTSRLNRV